MTMALDEAEDLHQQMAEVVSEDPRLAGLWRELLRLGVEYAHLRARWTLLPREERAGLDRTRTAAHDAFIDALNILARNCHAQGRDVTWREALGSERKHLGDFACHLALLLGLAAR